MSITTAVCNSFKKELLEGTHDLDTDIIKAALIKVSPSGTYGAATTNFANVTDNSDEAVGSLYTSGGVELTTPSIALDGSTAIVDFDDITFSSVTLSSIGCILYNTSKSNKAIAVISFGGTETCVNGDLVITLPTANASNAIIRIT